MTPPSSGDTREETPAGDSHSLEPEAQLPTDGQLDVVREANAVTPDSVAAQPPAGEQPGLPNVVGERYELAEIIEQTGGAVVYRAYDRMRCGQCGTLYADNVDTFCGECGAEMGSGALCHIQVGNIPPDTPPESLLTENEVTYWVKPAPGTPPTPAPPSRRLQLRVGHASDPGVIREMDEDCLLVMTGASVAEGSTRSSLGLFAVADGMGGHQNGQVASLRVIQVLAEQLAPGLFSPALSGETILAETFEAKVCDAVKEANRRLTLEARTANSDMGSTLTLAFVCDGVATIANVGDSRTYLWRNGNLEQVTEDHSMVARLVVKGIIQPHEVYEHPSRNEVYRVMGDKSDVDVDLFRCELRPGDRLVLCCDGVWEMLRNEGIEEVLLAIPDDPQAACAEIVKRSNLAGGEDNISVIIVDVH